MPQRAATIESLPAAFEVVKAMQADGLDWGEGCAPTPVVRPRSIGRSWRVSCSGFRPVSLARSCSAGRSARTTLSRVAKSLDKAIEAFHARPLKGR